MDNRGCTSAEFNRWRYLSVSTTQAKWRHFGQTKWPGWLKENRSTSKRVYILYWQGPSVKRLEQELMQYLASKQTHLSLNPFGAEIKLCMEKLHCTSRPTRPTIGRADRDPHTCFFSFLPEAFYDSTSQCLPEGTSLPDIFAKFVIICQLIL